MRLVPEKIESRSFLIQFYQIMKEFGSVIPWLDSMNEFLYMTNPAYFRDKFMLSLGADITPFQFIEEGNGDDYIGGILYFSKSPEKFKDYRNQEVKDFLDFCGYHFISCLQIRALFRGLGHGRVVMEEALKCAKIVHGGVWGVVSDIKLINWYGQVGGTLLSPIENKDNLWIIVFDDKDGGVK